MKTRCHASLSVPQTAAVLFFFGKLGFLAFCFNYITPQNPPLMGQFHSCLRILNGQPGVCLNSDELLFLVCVKCTGRRTRQYLYDLINTKNSASPNNLSVSLQCCVHIHRLHFLSFSLEIK